MWTFIGVSFCSANRRCRLSALRKAWVIPALRPRPHPSGLQANRPVALSHWPDAEGFVRRGKQLIATMMGEIVAKNSTDIAMCYRKNVNLLARN
jgi:hypothetical protein